MNTHNDIIRFSREIGADPQWVLAGGGNSSEKTKDLLFVKASGTSLSDMAEADLVTIDRDALETIWTREFPADPLAREEAVAEALLSARTADSVDRKPSVETFIHALLPQRFVMHTHPTKLNGLACAREGREAVAQTLGERVLWIPATNPGIALALEIRSRLSAFRETHETDPRFLVMQNHGLVVAGESIDEIRKTHAEILTRLDSAIETAPDSGPVEQDSDRLRPVAEATARALADLRAAHGSALERPVVTAFADGEILRFAASAAAAEPILRAPTPDHLMYSGHRVCFVPRVVEQGHPHGLAVDVLHAVTDYCHDEEGIPRIVLVEGAGAVAIGDDLRQAENAMALFRDTLRIARYAENFGGIAPLPEEQAAFVRSWKH